MILGTEADGISSTAYNGILVGSSPTCPICYGVVYNETKY